MSEKFKANVLLSSNYFKLH